MELQPVCYIDRVPIDVIGSICTFIMIGSPNSGSPEMLASDRAKRIKNFLMTSKRYYTSEILVDRIVKAMAFCELYRHRYTIFGPIYLNTPASHAWLKQKLRERKYMKTAGSVLRHLCDKNTAYGARKNFNLIKSTKIAKKLLDAGIPVDITNKKGKTPLMESCRVLNYEMFNFLLAQGANNNVRDKKGRTIDYYSKKSNFNFVKKEIEKIIFYE